MTSSSAPPLADERLSLLLYSSLFPSSVRPHAGLFIRERLRQVMPHADAVVVSPQPWFPGQALLRWLKPDYRPRIPYFESRDGLQVYSPRFPALPGVGRRFDGAMMAIGSWLTVRRLVREANISLIDAHFAYPDGYAASLLSRWLSVPFTVTLRGTEVRCCRIKVLRKRLLLALHRAAWVITVANSLADTVTAAGADASKIERVGNGVDTDRFQPVDPATARKKLGLPQEGPILVTVGGLVRRKGFHRVIEIMPALLRKWPGLRYLVVGGASPEGNIRSELVAQAAESGLEDAVVFLGAVKPDDLKFVLSASDVFVLATENEGWANVLLESMACGLPVVTTSVGGNPEVVESGDLGRLVAFGDGDGLREAIEELLMHPLDGAAIRRHAQANDWSRRVEQLLAIYRRASENLS